MGDLALLLNLIGITAQTSTSTGTGIPTAPPGILYKCRDSSVSVFPHGSTTTDTDHCATNAADAGTTGVFDVRKLSHTSTTNTNAPNINHPSTATTRTKDTCIRPCTHIVTLRQIIAHRRQSRLCILICSRPVWTISSVSVCLSL